MIAVYPIATEPIAFVTPSVTVEHDLCDLTDERILVQMDDSEGNRNFRDLMCQLSIGAQQYRDVALAVRDAFAVGDAVGAQLDAIGSVVGIAREGQTDARYRDIVRIQIDLLLSAQRAEAQWTGTSENLLTIARRFIGATVAAIVLTNFLPYGYQLTVPDLAYADAALLGRFLATATYAGVRGQLLVLLDDASNWGSSAVAVSGAGIYGSASVAVSNEALWNTAIDL
jgi:hypothetical protein